MRRHLKKRENVGVRGQTLQHRSSNFNLGLKEQLLFPEIDYDKVIRQRGMNITFVTTAKTDEEAMALLKELGMPFAR